MKLILGSRKWIAFGLVSAAIVAAVALLALLGFDRGGGPPEAEASHGNVNVPVGRNWFVAPECQIDLPEDGVSDLPAACVTTIHAGDTVTWGVPSWDGFHTVTGCPNLAAIQSDAECPGTLPIGDSGPRGSGSTYGPIAFTTAGTYYYKCNVHSKDHLGKIVVEPTEAPTPTPTPTPTPVVEVIDFAVVAVRTRGPGFANPDPGETKTKIHTVVVKNVGTLATSAEVHLHVEAEGDCPPPGVVAVDPTTVTLAPGRRASVQFAVTYGHCLQPLAAEDHYHVIGEVEAAGDVNPANDALEVEQTPR